MASRSEDYICATCCHLDHAQAILHPERIKERYRNSNIIDLKPKPRHDYSKEEAAGCRYCALISKCSADIMKLDTKKIGLCLAPDCPPAITGRYGQTLRTIYKTLSTDTSWDIIPFRPPILVPGIEYATAWIEARLEECCTSHRLCERISSVGPKRLLKLSTENHVSIVDTPEPLPNFVALSYCWGGDQESKLTQNTVEAFRDELPWDCLTVLHKDIIRLCRPLGLQYLWIDALCIIQDDRDDWVDQATVMADIYENAYLTISATCSTNPIQNIFDRGGPTYGGGAKVLQQSKDGVPLLASRKPIEVGHHRRFDDTFVMDILETRGWCFQESRLSRRMVSFTSQELQWQCRECRKCECDDPATEDTSNMLLYKGMKHTKKSKAYNLWGRLLQGYSATKLTKPEDRLVALAGLASRVASLTGSTYLAGLWRENLTLDLLWESHSSHKPFSTEYYAPTFSWASVGSPVEVIQEQRHFISGNWNPTVEIVDAHVDLKSIASPFGEVTGGSLRLKGWVSAARLEIRRSGIATIAIDGLEQAHRLYALLDGRIKHAENSETMPMASRLRIDSSHKALSRSSYTAWKGMSDDASSVYKNGEDGNRDDAGDGDREHDPDNADRERKMNEDWGVSQTNNSDDDDDARAKDSRGDRFSSSDDESSNASISALIESLDSFRVAVLHLGFLRAHSIRWDPDTSYYLILGRSPTHPDCYERLGLMQWGHSTRTRDLIIRKLPKQEVVIV